jgi:hypothetical protein
MYIYIDIYVHTPIPIPILIPVPLPITWFLHEKEIIKLLFNFFEFSASFPCTRNRNRIPNTVPVPVPESPSEYVEQHFYILLFYTFTIFTDSVGYFDPAHFYISGSGIFTTRSGSGIFTSRSGFDLDD